MRDIIGPLTEMTMPQLLGFTRMTGDLVKAIKTLSDRPILLIVNTHAHRDHVGGNAKVRSAGAYFATGNTRGGGDQ